MNKAFRELVESNKYELSFGPLVIACLDSLLYDNARGDQVVNLSQEARLVREQLSDRDIVGVLIQACQNETTPIVADWCERCEGFCPGGPCESCRINDERDAEFLRIAACEL